LLESTLDPPPRGEASPQRPRRARERSQIRQP
jgi:hypothetical protein